MPHYVNINGRFVPSDEPIVCADSRAFRYGYGLFETMLVRDRQIRLAAYHWARLDAGLKTLNITAPAHFFNELEDAILQTLSRNNDQALSRVRLQVWPSGGGYFDGDDFNAEYCIETFPLGEEMLQLNSNGLVLGIATDIIKSADHYSHIKSCNALPYALAARQAKRNHWNDALLLNQHGRIADSTIANFFWVKDAYIFTPPLTEGCVAGVMRAHLLMELPAWGYTIQEQAITVEKLGAADAVFLTNAIRGIRWAKECNTHNYSPGIVADLHQKLLRSF